MSPSDSLSNRVRRRLGSSQYLRDVLWQASGNTAAQVLGIAAMPLLTRLYAPSDFAALNLFSQAVAGLAILLTLRFEYLVMLPADQAVADGVLRLTFRLGAVHVLWFTPLLAYLPNQWVWLREQGVVADWLWLAPLSAWAVSLAVGAQQAVQRSGDFRSSASSEFVGRCAYVASALIGVLALPNLSGLMTSTLVSASAKLAWLFRVGRELLWTVVCSSKVSVPSDIRRMAISTSASNLISLFTGMAPMIFIADKYGASSLGQYGLVVSTLYLPSSLLGQAIGQVYYQRACRLHGDGVAFTEILVKTSKNLAKISFPLYGLIALVAPWVYPLVFGPEWGKSGEMARWLCIAAAAGFLSTPLDRSSLIVGAWWYLSAWHAWRALTTAACLFYSTVYGLTIENCIAMLSLQNAFAYTIDWVSSYIFSLKSRPLLTRQ